MSGSVIETKGQKCELLGRRSTDGPAIFPLHLWNVLSSENKRLL